MTEKREKLAQIILDIARAKRDRKAKKKPLKTVPNTEKATLESILVTIEAGIEASKAQRDAVPPSCRTDQKVSLIRTDLLKTATDGITGCPLR
jgi:hypothetical protein